VAEGHVAVLVGLEQTPAIAAEERDHEPDERPQPGRDERQDQVQYVAWLRALDRDGLVVRMRLDPRAVLPYLVGDYQREKLLALCRRP
jgi:hypothetical protein